jgi:hypothetical protein
MKNHILEHNWNIKKFNPVVSEKNNENIKKCSPSSSILQSNLSK